MKRPNDELFEQVFQEVTQKPIYQTMKGYKHHANVSVYDHCIHVAIYCYNFSKRLHLKVQQKSLVRGALLHDYYLYDWHNKNKGFHFHGYKHAKIALKNATRDYELNAIEKDMIVKHMFPLNLFSVPKYKESVILVLCDKWVSILECFHLLKSDLVNCQTKCNT